MPFSPPLTVTLPMLRSSTVLMGIAAVIVAFKLTSRSIRKREQAAEDED